MKEKKVVVVGGGLVGSLAALSMARLGFRVEVVERREDWRHSGAEAELDVNLADKSVSKRSINLALSKRGIEALKDVGLEKEVMELTIPMHGRAIHTSHGLMFQRYDEVDERNFINSISREALNELLLDAAEKHPSVKVTHGKQLMHVDRKNHLHFLSTEEMGRGTFDDVHDGDYVIRDADLILGCDGAYSAVRESLMRLQSTNYSRVYSQHGYMELEIRPDENTKDYRLNRPNALHIWPRNEFMMIALPNTDKSFTCTIFAPLEELSRLQGAEEIKAYFEKNFPEVIPDMPDFVQQVQWNPACRLVMSKVGPWNLKDRICLLGDAAHAMWPFYGQGMNAGLEDVLELTETIRKYELDLTRAIPAFAKIRKPRGDAIVDLSLRNYEEMRSHTASRLFLIRKRLEGVLNWLFPRTWVPLYKMVAFTRIPYNEAVAREAVQDRILHGLLSIAVTVGVVSFLSVVPPTFARITKNKT